MVLCRLTPVEHAVVAHHADAAETNTAFQNEVEGRASV